jgi:hypothetical protein
VTYFRRSAAALVGVLALGAGVFVAAPPASADPDGSGTLTVDTPSVQEASVGDTLNFTFTFPAGFDFGNLEIQIPSGWSTPTESDNTAPGYVTNTCQDDGNSIVGNTIQVVGINQAALDGSCTVTFGDTSGGGPGATAPSTAGTDTFNASETNAETGGTYTPLTAGSPSVDVTSVDGEGTVTAATSSYLAGTAASDAFTYTAGADGVIDGSLELTVPAGWTTPSVSSGQAGYTSTDCGSASVSTTNPAFAGIVDISDVNLGPDDSCTIAYGDTTDSSEAVTVADPATTTSYDFNLLEAGRSGTSPTQLAAPAVVTAQTEAGAGTMTVAPTSAVTGNVTNLVFSYTADSLGMQNGQIDADLPTGWGNPQPADPASADYATSDCGLSPIINATTIEVEGVTLPPSGTCEIDYENVTPPGGASNGENVFNVSQGATDMATPASLASSPETDISEAGGGTMTVDPTAVAPGSSNALTFTYTADSYGMSDGNLYVNMAGGWTQATGSAGPGYTTSDCGTLSFSTSLISVGGVTLAPDASCQITYSSATAPTATGVEYFFPAQSQDDTSLNFLASSPSVDTEFESGVGTLSTGTSSVSTGSTNTLNFTYTADANPMINGEIDMSVPSDWSTPSPLSTASGYVSSDCGTVAAVGDTVEITTVNLDASASCTITYANAVAPSQDETSTFGAVEASGPNGTAALGSSPEVDVTSPILVPPPTNPPGDNPPAPTCSTGGYREAAADGSVYAFGGATFDGSLASIGTHVDDIIGLASTPCDGYWLVGSDGGVFAFGDATFYGSMASQHLHSRIVGMVATPDAGGYWLVAADGGVFAFGDAGYFGSMGGHPLNSPIVGIAETFDAQGYWLVAADGGVFSFGDASFYGSMGGRPLNAPVVGMSASPDGAGYTLVASDGGIFTFGDTGFYRSPGGTKLNAPVVGITTSPDGAGYTLAAADGGVFAYGDATYVGSMGGLPMSAPVTALAPGYSTGAQSGD